MPDGEMWGVWPWTYVAVWSSLCLAAAIAAVRQRHALRERYRGYRAFLSAPWKLGTFIVAFLGIVLIAPYTGDPYWDYVVAAVMATSTFLTAPWFLGVIVRSARRRAPIGDLALAICAWLFAASWSYDGWNLARDGSYPLTWAVNVPASSFLYFMGGAFWSLDHRQGLPRLASLDKDWPQPSSPGAFVRLLPWTLPIMGLVAFLIVSFVFDWVG